jgi:hypothetical protein
VIISRLDSYSETPVASRAAEFQGVWENEQRSFLYEDTEFSSIKTFSSYSKSQHIFIPGKQVELQKPAGGIWSRRCGSMSLDKQERAQTKGTSDKPRFINSGPWYWNEFRKLSIAISQPYAN